MNRWYLYGMICIVFPLCDAVGEDTTSQLCEWKSSTLPDAIKGSQGTSSEDTYWFSHFSDVDKDKDAGIHTYVFAIRNFHSTNYLPVEWERGDRNLQIEFQRLVPEGCAANSFQSTHSFREDVHGAIKYGPIAQGKKDAPLYVVVEPDKSCTQIDGGKRPVLTSRLFAQIAPVDEGRTFLLDIEFSATQIGTKLTYKINNRSQEDVLFEVPDYSKAWSATSTTATVEYESRWPTFKGVYLARVSKDPQAEVVSVSSDVRLHEQVVPMNITTVKGGKLIKGYISVYLPVK